MQIEITGKRGVRRRIKRKRWKAIEKEDMASK